MNTKHFLPATLVPMLFMAQSLAQIDVSKAEFGPTLENEIDRISYWLGNQLGNNVKTIPIEIDIDIIIRAIEDVLSDRTPALNKTEMAATQTAFQQKLRSEQVTAATKNHAEGSAFLEANASKNGVSITESGLQYKVLTAGSGPTPIATDRVEVHYRGTLLDGTEFDSSYKRNVPASFSVNGVIPGWTEALQLMEVGAKWQLFIPAALAYGNNPPRGSMITSGAMLIFEVELLKIL